ncbi:MAG: pyruvate kinase, partial [Clostridia bacterium]|nr:pyruvate kinase [Clostridia bacterium]
FSHGTHAEQEAGIRLVQRVRDDMGAPLGIMLDTKGPEYRIGAFADGAITLNSGDEFTLTPQDVPGDSRRVSVSYHSLASELTPGDRILLNNGLIELKVVELCGADVVCRVAAGGVLSSRKSMSFPGKLMSQPYLSEQDRADLLLGIKLGVEFAACSFVSRKEDIIAVREFLAENGGGDIDLIAKIENRAGVANIDEIIDVSDGIMVARGDLGVEIPFEELPAIQKLLITRCRRRGKRVITATEMLESMIHNVRPTRAEISDVANAVYDGTSALMLSGETAAGEHPVESVEAMARIAAQTENDINYRRRFMGEELEIKNDADAISHATCALAMDVKASLIVVCTLSGATARMVSRFRPPVFMLGMTTDEKVWHKLALSWGVIPILSEEFNSLDVMFYHAALAAKRSGLTMRGDKVVITGGVISGKPGNTNQIKLETV